MIEEEEEERNKDCGAETDLLLEGRALVLAPSPFCLPIPMRRCCVLFCNFKELGNRELLLRCSCV